MSAFAAGDVVRIGKGKVEYAVSEVNADDTLNLTGEKSNRKNVDSTTLTLVTAARNAVHATEEMLNAVLNVDEVEDTARTVEYPMAVWEIELLAPLHSGPFLLTVDHVTTGYKSFGAAADALVLAQREGFEHYAVIDHNGQRKVARTAV